MKYFNLPIFILLISCNNTSHSNRGEVETQLQDTIYDLFIGELVRETEDSLWFEPYQRKIPKVRKIFRKGKNYQFLAEYKDKDNNILSKSELRIISFKTIQKKSGSP